MLANLALDGLESLLAEHFSQSGRHIARNKVHLVRYADDFVITGSSQELLQTRVKPLLQQFLAERGLELSLEKTRITPIEDGFDFLGQNLRKYDGKLIIKPSKANVARLLANVREVVKVHKAATAGELVRMLTPKLRVWAMYHRHICAKRTFQQVDTALFHTLWQWCVRRHPNKGKRWLARKYFTTVAGAGGGNHWVFFGEVTGRDESKRSLVLFQTSRVRIGRHVKIRKEVNPYAPRWQEYLLRRHRRVGYRVDDGADLLMAETIGALANTE